MIKIEIIQERTIRATPIGKLQAQDIKNMTPKVDDLIAQFGQVNILVDLRQFYGWENFAALKQHTNFVKAHHRKVGRIAVISRAFWQNIIFMIAKIILNKDAKSFKEAEEKAALDWVLAK